MLVRNIAKETMRFCRTCAAVLDCANGYQKENQEEVNNIEEERRQEIVGEPAYTEARNS